MKWTEIIKEAEQDTRAMVRTCKRLKTCDMCKFQEICKGTKETCMSLPSTWEELDTVKAYVNIANERYKRNKK